MAREHNTDACPDCSADTELEEITPGFTTLHVYHDANCPNYRRYVEQWT